MSALRRRMDQDMLVRGMAVKTRVAYIGAAAGLARHYRRSPEAITAREVQDYLVHLMQERKLSWNTCNVVASGLKFLYHITLGRERDRFAIPAPRCGTPGQTVASVRGGVRRSSGEACAVRRLRATWK